MVFMKKYITILTYLCVMVKYNHSQEPTTLFNCTFNDGAIDDCILKGTTKSDGTTNDLQIDAGEVWKIDARKPPHRPLSDATSVFSPTINGNMCQFPHLINNRDIYFCHRDKTTSDHMCPALSNDNQICVKGSYAYLSSTSWKEFKQYYDTREIHHSDVTEPQCLTFYYYFTNNKRFSNIKIIWQTNSHSVDVDSLITNVSPEPINKWQKIKVPFFVPYTDYKIQFQFYRGIGSFDTNPFSLAIDDITITSGSCSMEKKLDSKINTFNLLARRNDKFDTVDEPPKVALSSNALSIIAAAPPDEMDAEPSITTPSPTTPAPTTPAPTTPAPTTPAPTTPAPTTPAPTTPAPTTPSPTTPAPTTPAPTTPAPTTPSPTTPSPTTPAPTTPAPTTPSPTTPAPTTPAPTTAATAKTSTALKTDKPVTGQTPEETTAIESITEESDSSDSANSNSTESTTPGPELTGTAPTTTAPTKPNNFGFILSPSFGICILTIIAYLTRII